MKPRAYLFQNGVTVFIQNGAQVAELQTPWIDLYFQFLESKGIDPTTVEFYLPGGVFRAFKTSNGSWNWEPLKDAD